MSGYPETVLTKQWKFVRTIKTFTLLSHQDSAGELLCWCGVVWCDVVWCGVGVTTPAMYERYIKWLYLTLCWPGDPS